MILEARPHALGGHYPVTLLDGETGHVFGHATDSDSLRALVRVAWIGAPLGFVPPVGGVVVDAIARIRARRGR